MDELKQDGIDLDAIRDEDVSVVRQAMQDAMNTHGPYSFPAQGRHIAEALFVAGWRSPAVVAGLVAEVESITQMNADWQVEYRKAQDRADHWRREFERQAAELDRWRAAVREAGIDYPLSPVAVEDLAAMADGRLEDLQQANRRLGAVAALADRGTGTDLNPTRLMGGADDRFWMGYLARLDELWRARIRAVLGPVSGAVEGAGVFRLTADPARVVPCPHDCGWVGPLDDFHLHRATCPVRADLLATPVAGHEQEVRGERPESWQAGDQVTRTYTRDLNGDWRWSDGRFQMDDDRVDDGVQYGDFAIVHLAARASGSSASVQGGAES